MSNCKVTFYTTLNSIVTTKQNTTAAVVNVVTGITYAPLSHLLTALNHGNGLATTAGYDLDGHLIAEATASTGATSRDYISAAANDKGIW